MKKLLLITSLLITTKVWAQNKADSVRYTISVSNFHPITVKAQGIVIKMDWLSVVYVFNQTIDRHLIALLQSDPSCIANNDMADQIIAILKTKTK